jgi:hypothetical protein
MNKILSPAAVLLLLIMTGCLQIPMALAPDEAVPMNPDERKNGVLSFSVEQIIDGPFISLDGIATEKVLVRRIREQLLQSGMFEAVEHRPFGRRGDLHIHFIAHYSTVVRREPVMVLALFGIPFRIPSYLDMTAIVFKKEKALYSPAISEGMHNYVWLVFLPAAAVWNSWWAWTTQEKKCSRVLIARIRKKLIRQ